MTPTPEQIAECQKYLEENLDRSYSQDSETINAIAAHFAAKIEEAKREGYNAALEEAAKSFGESADGSDSLLYNGQEVAEILRNSKEPK